MTNLEVCVQQRIRQERLRYKQNLQHLLSTMPKYKRRFFFKQPVSLLCNLRLLRAYDDADYWMLREASTYNIGKLRNIKEEPKYGTSDHDLLYDVPKSIWDV